MRFPNESPNPIFLPVTAGTPGVVREHSLPGDTFAGRDLAESAAAWGPLGETVFVRLRVLSPLSAHLAVLSFDRNGFGTLLSGTIAPGAVPSEIRGMLHAPAAVVLCDSPEVAEGLLLDGSVETRTFDRLRAFEHNVLGLTRRDADLDADVWTAARTADPWAARWVAEAARADLFALVALAGGDVTFH